MPVLFVIVLASNMMVLLTAQFQSSLFHSFLELVLIILELRK